MHLLTVLENSGFTGLTLDILLAGTEMLMESSSHDSKQNKEIKIYSSKTIQFFLTASLHVFNVITKIMINIYIIAHGYHILHRRDFNR